MSLSSTSSLRDTLLRPFMPPIRTIRAYNLRKLRKDLIAGLTVSVVEVPQAMAYAIIAGVPPVYGIYTSIIQGVIGAMLSSSEHMTTGPTNTQSLLVASAVHRMVSPNAGPEEYLQVVFGLTMLKGLIQLAFAGARLGRAVRYVSRSVIVGLVSGAGVLILFNQLPAFLGIRGASASRWPGIIGPLQYLAEHTGEVNSKAVAIGAAALAIVFAVRWISKLLPGPLFAVIASAALVWALGWTTDQLPLIDMLPASLPSFHVPSLSWGVAEQLLWGALALAVIGMLESVAIAKSIAAHSGEEISANQEFFAQGLKNFISSFWQCIPGSGSFTRSALDYAAGAETRFAAVFNALFVAAIFLLFGRQAQYIPRATLAAVLFVIALGLIDWRYGLRLLRSNRSDAVVCIGTFGATLFAPLEYAIFIGIFLNLAMYVRQTTHLHVAEMVPDMRGSPGNLVFVETPLQDRAGLKQVVFLQLEGDLFFGIADELQDRLSPLARAGPRVVIVRLKRTHSVDASILHTFEQFITQMRRRDAHVIFCGVRPELMRVLRGYGLVKLVGEANVFESGPGVFASAKQALARAVALLGASVDSSAVEERLSREVEYEI